VNQPCVYIMASKRNGTLYTGVTADLAQRVWAHREGIGSSFTKRYGVSQLVWYEPHPTM
jgi:putative endonuclease